MRASVASFVFVAALAVPSVALAGGCPTCTTSADCMPPGGGEGFCVMWSRDFGCGSQRVACCPGQGCDTFSGRPSCEDQDSDGDGVDDCQVIDEDAGAPMVDAGPPTAGDAGPPGDEAGVPDPDAGPGMTGMDSGPAMMGGDAGPEPMSDGGCSCRAAGTPSRTPLALLLLLPALTLLRSRT